MCLKLTLNGTLLASKSYGGLGTQAGVSISTDLIDDVLLLNEIPTFSGNTQQDVSLIKTDNNLSHSCILDSFPLLQLPIIIPLQLVMTVQLAIRMDK